MSNLQEKKIVLASRYRTGTGNAVTNYQVPVPVIYTEVLVLYRYHNIMVASLSPGLPVSCSREKKLLINFFKPYR
jgi:hypothetical protein